MDCPTLLSVTTLKRLGQAYAGKLQDLQMQLSNEQKLNEMLRKQIVSESETLKKQIVSEGELYAKNIADMHKLYERIILEKEKRMNNYELFIIFFE